MICWCLQVAATTDSPESSQWNAYSARGPAVASAANLANKLEAVVASGLPSAISETYGQPGNPLTADKILEFLQGKSTAFCASTAMHC